ncbi:E3 ubiquitin-protein ligase trim-21 isoform X3 [Cherax quadricarinatus]
MSLYPTLPDDTSVLRESKSCEASHSLLPTCSVCLDEFCEKRLPKYLTCHHTFCDECIHQLLKFGKIECPLCRKITQVTSADVLQTNNDVLTMANYGNLFVNLWCHDCQDIPKATCMTHNVSNRSATSCATIGQQVQYACVDRTVEAWTPSVMRLVETTQGWALIAVDATYSTITSISEYVTPLTSYITDWFNSFMENTNP